MTEYEKASILMLSAIAEYLHIIAWAHRNGQTNGRKVADIPVEIMAKLVQECPEVSAMLARKTTS